MFQYGVGCCFAIVSFAVFIIFFVKTVIITSYYIQQNNEFYVGCSTM